MPDWIESLNEEERSQWDEFVDSVRRGAVEKIAGSEFMVSFVPNKADVKFAVELGLGIMMDKPIIAIVMPGREVPEKLRLVADEIVYADIDTEQGRQKFQDVVARFVDTYAR